MFETVLATVTFSRRLFVRSGHSAYIEQVLRDLSLWDKRNNKIMELSGGMKRRVLIAKALSHEPDILFLDEPTAVLDPDLSEAFVALIKSLHRELGLTVVMVTHSPDHAAQASRTLNLLDGRVVVDALQAA